jgi:glycogen phosphorylase
MVKITALANQIAYFSMEIALAAEMPTYSGGLAGGTVRSAADLKVPMVAVTLLYG